MGFRHQTRAFHLPFRGPFAFGGGSVTSRPILLLRLEADGQVGWGEAAPLPGFLDAPLPEIERSIGALFADDREGFPLRSPAIAGDPMRVAESFASQDDAAAVRAPQHLASPDQVAELRAASAAVLSGANAGLQAAPEAALPGTALPDAAARLAAAALSDSAARLAAAALSDSAARLAAAALDTALSDAAARAARLPLARWLVPDAPLHVATNRLLRLDDAAQACADAADLRAAGVEVAKLKLLPGRWLGQLAILAEVLRREPSLRVRADGNASWEPTEAAAVLEALASFPVEYVEEPLALRFGVEAFLALAARSPVPLAADERLLDPEQRAALLAADWEGVFVLKPMFLGGPRPALAIARRAAERGIRSTVTTALDGAVGRAMAGALACAVEGLGIGTGAHGLETGALLANDIPLEPDLDSSDRCPFGLGCTPSWHKATEEGP